MKVELAFAKTKQSVEIDDKNILDVLTPNEVKVELTGGAEVERALANPIGSKKLSEIVKPGEKIAIITSDITRPMPSKIVMPYVIAEIEKAGCDLKDVTVVFALGSHRSHTDEEKRYLVGDEVFEKVNCVDSDGTKCIHLGTTKAGTPVDVFEPVAKADRLICMGNIEFHYFAGYSGGAKAIMPGVSTHDAIQKNHSMMVNEDAHAGKIEGNPIREDIDSVVEFRPIDFIVNVVLNEKKEIIKAVAGRVVELCSPVEIYLATYKQNLRQELTAFKLLIVVNDVKKVSDIEEKIYMETDCEIPFDVIVYNKSVWEKLIDDYGTFAHKVYESGDKLYG